MLLECFREEETPVLGLEGMDRSLPGQLVKGGKGNPGRGKSNAKAQKQEKAGWGSHVAGGRQLWVWRW